MKGEVLVAAVVWEGVVVVVVAWCGCGGVARRRSAAVETRKGSELQNQKYVISWASSIFGLSQLCPLFVIQSHFVPLKLLDLSLYT